MVTLKRVLKDLFKWWRDFFPSRFGPNISSIPRGRVTFDFLRWMISMEWIKKDNYLSRWVFNFASKCHLFVSGWDEATGNKIGKWNGKQTDFFTPDHQTNANKNVFAHRFPPSSLKNEFIRIVINLIWLPFAKQSSTLVVRWPRCSLSRF